MLTGVYAARNILGEKYDVWSVNTEQEYTKRVALEGVRSGAPGPKPPEPESAPPSRSSDAMIEAAFAKLDPLALGSP